MAESPTNDGTVDLSLFPNTIFMAIKLEAASTSTAINIPHLKSLFTIHPPDTLQPQKPPHTTR
jgi:hypothetical protein